MSTTTKTPKVREPMSRRMKTYEEYIRSRNVILRYYYDFYLKLWTVYEIDDGGCQTSGEADYYSTMADLMQYERVSFSEDCVVD